MPPLLCLLLTSLLVASVSAQCAPTFPAANGCQFVANPPPVTFYIDTTQNTWVQPSSVTMIIRTDLSVVYSVVGQFTFYPSGGTQFTVQSTLTWMGWYSTAGDTNCGCACSGTIMLASLPAATSASCSDSYANSNPGSYNFCTNFRFLNYYFSGLYSWALNQDSTNKFLILSRLGQTPGSALGAAFVPYTSTPGAMWGEPAMYFAETGSC